MITFQEETYETLMLHSDFEELANANFEETGVLKNSRKFKLNLDMYKILAKQNILVVYSVKNNNSIVGYYVGCILEHPNYPGTIIAESDAFFVHNKFRKGLTGYKFLKYVVEKLKQKVDLIFLTTNTKRDLSKVLDRLDFKLADYKFILEVK